MSLEKLIDNNRNFRKNLPIELVELYQSLGSGQKPIAMLITCVDSRILPEQLLGFKPGEVFCLRNVANLVAQEGNDPSTESAIKYAVSYLGIKHIIVMGHSNCGGINALVNGIDDLAINSWLNPWQKISNDWDKKDSQSCEQSAVLHSIDNIRNMSFINNDINLHAWHFDIDSACIKCYDKQNHEFIEL